MVPCPAAALANAACLLGDEVFEVGGGGGLVGGDSGSKGLDLGGGGVSFGEIREGEKVGCLAGGTGEKSQVSAADLGGKDGGGGRAGVLGGGCSGADSGGGGE